MSHKQAKKARTSLRTAVIGGRGMDDLAAQLREQVSFLVRSAAAFDAGFEDEAKRLALTIRVLVHDTAQSHSLLDQLGIKKSIRFVDTADPIVASNLATTLGLVMLRVTNPGAASYVPHLGDGPPHLYGRTAMFLRWWETPVTKTQEGHLYSRKEYVLPIANQEGGGHVDPTLSPMFDDFLRRNPFGWYRTTEAGKSVPLAGNGALVAVRQIAWEVEKTLEPFLREPKAARHS